MNILATYGPPSLALKCIEITVITVVIVVSHQTFLELLMLLNWSRLAAAEFLIALHLLSGTDVVGGLCLINLTRNSDFWLTYITLGASTAALIALTACIV